MNVGLLLILIVAGAYLAAHSAAEWLARRFLIVSGAEYLLLGVLLGPEVTGVIQATTVGPFAPFLTLALGWVGALVGAQFYVPDLIRLPASHFGVAVSQACLVLATAAGATAAGGIWLLGLGWDEVWPAAVAMGAIAVSSAPTAVALVTRKLRTGGFLLRQLHVTAAMDGLVAIVALGVLLTLSHPAPPGPVRSPTATEWVVITIAIGLVGGALFHLFVGTERGGDRLFIALAGAIILTSGAAAYLRLSPILAAFLLGFVVVNTSGARQTIRQVLTGVERPLYFVLLIFAGGAWSPEIGPFFLLALLLVGARIVAKIGGARLAARFHGQLATLGPRWGWGLIGHGGLAVALALSYRLNDGTPMARAVFTATLLSIVVTDVLSARLVEALVVTASDGARETGPQPRLPAEESR